MTVEQDETRAKPLLPPMILLGKSTTNAETEERKRVFWNTFLLDRLCSITCGWTTGFTSDNVSRQLPCNGGIWRRSEESSTPYFGLWEKSQGTSTQLKELCPKTKTFIGRHKFVGPASVTSTADFVVSRSSENGTFSGVPANA